MADFEPKQFGKYYLIEKLAVGGMAEIYKAKTYGVDGFEKLLAVKRILPHCSADKEFIAMLVDEAKLSVTLSHANIVQVYDLGKVGDDYFISMEYINSINLRDIIYRCRDKGVKIPSELAAFILSEVCKGLDYAHRKSDASGQPLNIVHRDVSPQNILISHEGEVKIVDFGIAKAAMNISHTMAGILKGKIAYMSPEQALGKTVDYRTDIFSAGIVLFEALTSEKLFTGESQFEVLKKIRSTKIDHGKIPEGIPEGLKDALVKALAYYPKDRYQTAGDMQIDLTKYLYTTYVDFTPQKLASFIKDLFADEIAKQRERAAFEQVLEAQTSSINIAEEALQENLVHREETSPTIQVPDSTDKSITAGRQAPEAPKRGKMGLGPRITAAASVLVLLAGLGFAYVKFIHPRVAPKAGITTQSGTINVFSNPAGAKIFLDDKETDLVTPAIMESLSIGKTYKVKLSKEAFIDTEKIVTVASAEAVNLEMEMEHASGTLEITTEPSEVAVFINGSSTGQMTPTTLTGLELNKDVKITLVKPGFKNLDQTVKLTNYKPQALTAKLAPASDLGSIIVSSNPAGAAVFLNGRDTGLTTPANLTNIPIGEKQIIRLSKAGFEDITRTATLKDTSPATVAAELVAKTVEKKTVFTTANISSTPAGARVYLNNKNTGLRTPTTLKNLEVGKTYGIRLEKLNFEPLTKDLAIASAAPLIFKGELKEIKKTPVTPPPVAPTTAPAPAPAPTGIGPVPSSPVPVAPVPSSPVPAPAPAPSPAPAPAPAPSPAPTAEAVKSTEPAATPSAPEESYGPESASASLKIASSPSGAEVFVNAEYRGTTPTMITNLRPGVISLLVNKEGRARLSQKISLRPGEVKDLGTVRLGDLYGSVSVSSTPSRAVIIFDGEEVGAKTPVTIKKVRRDKEHTIKLLLPGYRAWERTFDMSDADDKKFNVTLEK